MGSGSWSPSDWKTYSKSRSYDSKTVDKILTQRDLHPDLNIKGTVRESCDSADNPQSTPLILALDVTGSMGMIASVICKTGLNLTLSEIYARKPITNPHCLIMGIGDVEYDSVPVQATQFEADIRIAEQLEKVFLEGGGGGNHYESYAAAWYFAARHTACDAIKKRGRKGYLFTIGDEQPTKRLTRDRIAAFFGDTLQADVDIDALLTEVTRSWEVFHIMVAEGSHARSHADIVRREWTDLLGQRAIWMPDHTKVAELIVSTIQLVEGETIDTVADSWDGSTGLMVRSSLAGLQKRAETTSGLVTL